MSVCMKIKSTKYSSENSFWSKRDNEAIVPERREYIYIYIFSKLDEFLLTEHNCPFGPFFKLINQYFFPIFIA